MAGKEQKSASYQRSKLLGRARVASFPLVTGFKSGYRNREDITTLPPGVLVTGSQNVLTNTSQRVGIVKGYVLDGQRDTSGNPILSSYDWQRHTGDERHLRGGFDVLNSLGKLQYRYVASAGDKWNGNTFTAGQVYWIDLMTGLGNGTDDTGVRFRFAEFWDFSNELKSMLLFVNQTSNIFMWTGGVTTAASYTANTITKTGTKTWAQEGFLNTATYTRQVLINGTAYTYTGGAGTTTLTGVAPDPSGEPVQSVVTQNVVTTANSAISGIPASFQNDLIATVLNQVYLGGAQDNSVYVSKTNSFLDFTFSSPRAVGQGALLTLDAVPTAFAPESDSLFISAGLDFWYQTQFTLDANTNKQALNVTRLKTTARQASMRQEATTKIKNNIFYLSNEPITNSLGTAQNYLNDPQAQDLSFSIVNDMDAYDLTDASCYFHKKYAYLCVPKESLLRVYNMTDDGSVDVKTGNLIQNHYWEAPIGYAMSLLAVIEGDLYGHSYQSSNTFRLFDGYDFDGNTYEAIAAFSFENSGSRNFQKVSTSAFTEGYITSNTTLKQTLQDELTGGTTRDFIISGADTTIVQQPDDVASLGKDSLGKHSLGGEDVFTDQVTNPPKFRVYKTYNPKPYFEEQVRYSSLGVNQVWEIVAFGTDAKPASELPTQISE